MRPAKCPVFSSKINTGFPSHGFLLTLIMVSLSVFDLSCSSTKATADKDNDGYQLIFDGKTLDGWDYDPVYWRVDNGVLVGEITPTTLLKRNSFIIKKDL